MSSSSEPRGAARGGDTHHSAPSLCLHGQFSPSQATACAMVQMDRAGHTETRTGRTNTWSLWWRASFLFSSSLRRLD